MADDAVQAQLHGTVVMAHGNWGHPDDWQWVRAPLDAAGLDVIAVDLPSHRAADPGLREDGAAVRDAVRDATRPIIAVGWSYGCWVVSEAVQAGARIDHLVLLGSVPMSTEDEGDEWMENDPHIQKFPDGRYLLDSDWWLDEEAGRTLAEPVRVELRRIGRRPSNRNTHLAVSGRDWTGLPGTVQYGVDDPFVTSEEAAWAAERFDTRVVPGDHFVLFRTPEVVSDLLLKVMRGLQP